MSGRREDPPDAVYLSRSIWEYLTESMNGLPHTLANIRMNELGREGWELVAVTGQMLIFKRVIDIDEVTVKT